MVNPQPNCNASTTLSQPADANVILQEHQDENEVDIQDMGE